MKKAFTLVEILIVFILILLTAYLIIPSILNDTKQAENVSKWKYAYHNIDYMFKAIGAQGDFKEIQQQFLTAQNDDEREEMLFELLSPYMRTKEQVNLDEYRPRFLNSNIVKESDYYYFKNLHLTNSGDILGVKWISNLTKASENYPVAILLYDTNGLKKPNKWGVDIFGINIFVDKIEPFGKGLDDNLLKGDCSAKGDGVYCAYYYYIFGNYIE